MKNIYKKIALFSIILSAIVIVGQIVIARVENPIVPTVRWLAPFHGGFEVATTSQTFTVGKVLMAEFANPTGSNVDQVCYVVGGTSAGSVTVGIYGPVVTSETSSSLPVVVQSASTAQGTANTSQCISLTSTYIPAGLYYAVLEGSDATGTFQRHGNQTQVVGFSATYARGGGYGALTDPSPATTNSGSAIPALKVRVSN